jgi:hypothetical protein
MHPFPSPPAIPRAPAPSQRGGIILTVLLLSTIIAVGTYAILSLGVTNLRLNHAQSVQTRGHLATESALEYAVAQAHGRLKSSTYLAPDLFLRHPPSTLPLESFPPIAKVTDATVTTGIVPGGGIVYLDPADPDNFGDPLIGQIITARTVVLIGHTTVDGKDFHGKLSLQIRDANLFNYNVFFANDLSLGGKGDIDYNGHIYAGGRIRYGNSGDGTQLFRGTVVTADTLEHIPTSTGLVSFRARDLTLKSASDGILGHAPSFLDHDTIPPWAIAAQLGRTWATVATNYYGGTVQDKNHGIRRFSPAALDLDERRDETGALIPPPDPRFMIESPIPIPPHTTPEKFATDTLSHAQPFDPEIEKLKLSTRANLVLEIDFDYPATYQPRLDLKPDGNPYGDTRPLSLTKNSSSPSSSEHDFSSPATASRAYHANRLTDPNKITVRAYEYTPDPQGPYLREDGARYRRRDISANFSALVGDTADPAAIVKTTKTSETPDGSAHTGPIKFWDHRRRQWIHSADIDLGALKTALDAREIDPAKWNGGVYIETKVRGKPIDTRSDGRTDGTPLFDDPSRFSLDSHPSPEAFAQYSRTGIRLVNGAAGQIPTTPDVDGLTLASNNHVYIHGHLNADGLLAAPGQDDEGINHNAKPDPAEVPVAIIADTVSVQSPSWKDESSRLTLDHLHASDIEISAAIAAGIMPGTTTIGEAASSRSSDTMVRFMENYQGAGRNYIYRGSVVNLWNSRVSPQARVNHGLAKTDQVPGDGSRRTIVFAQLFGQGRFPPISPTARTYRRLHYRDIYAAEYAELSALLEAADELTSAEYADRLSAIRTRHEL